MNSQKDARTCPSHTQNQLTVKNAIRTKRIHSKISGCESKAIHPATCGKLLYLGRAVDSTLLLLISAIVSQQANPTKETLEQMRQLLDYLASQEETVLTYSARKMIVAVHSDASYLSVPNARSQAGRHFFLSSNDDIPGNNRAILNIAHIIKSVMSSVTEAKLAALCITAKQVVYIHIILEKMGHKQPPTLVQTDNAMVEGMFFFLMKLMVFVYVKGKSWHLFGCS